ncbi:hexapeptide transferase family protein [Nitritalea halalkaliphila LW7]|uniref:Hexapeptide transferase family protein n=1 Tax=Nitritalea halalkaliphila LW7 TaxID=1189621 RepID=I5C603_9BACT|nr:sugar-transfer associated ATP-grasp domain-containing protein [Nitritalea halalkaliphila]EIM77255.1 hexapeptide transferase family protein [Nitritalea halalkaliphila LW7]
MLKRVAYLGYYIKQLDRNQFDTFANHVAKTKGKSTFSLKADALSSVFRYNVSLMEYFQFRFFEKTAAERSQWAGTGYMYEFQLHMNPKAARNILDDKTLFYKAYTEFFKHQVADLTSLKENKEKVLSLLTNPAGKVVLKVSDGKCGKGVLIRETKDFTVDSLITFMEKEGYELAEQFLIQHERLQELSPSAVNTVRIFTQLTPDNQVDLLGCRLRISVNSPVDNMAAGNLAAPIEDATGIVSGPGVYSDITKKEAHVHPVSKVAITGFQVPFWKETLEMVKTAALKHPQNRSIGWDVVITADGPGLIEGNHDWCKLLWQLPVNKGLKNQLERYK